MTKYDIAELAREQFPNRRKKTVQMLPIRPLLKFSLEYRKLLRAYLRELERVTREEVLPLIESQEAVIPDGITKDREWWFSRLREWEANLRQRVIARVQSIFTRQASKHRQRFLTEAKNVIGIDVRAVVREEDMEELLETYSAQNASLITSLGADTIKKVERVIYAHQLGEVGYENISKMLQKQFQLSRVRADLIATDQVQKLGADLNRARQQQAGITTYLWRTSKDERVRSRHRELDGNTYEWGEATGAEEGLPPGKPIRCRCVAIAQIEIGQ